PDVGVNDEIVGGEEDPKEKFGGGGEHNTRRSDNRASRTACSCAVIVPKSELSSWNGSAWRSYSSSNPEPYRVKLYRAVRIPHQLGLSSRMTDRQPVAVPFSDGNRLRPSNPPVHDPYGGVGPPGVTLMPAASVPVGARSMFATMRSSKVPVTPGMA